LNTLLYILVQVIIYALLLLLAEYAGFMLAVILGSISFFIWAISHIVELIAPSRVGGKYYGLVLSCWVGPLIAVLGFAALQGGFYWLG
jgi:inner membrane protein involved in colicin E2 resistance